MSERKHIRNFQSAFAIVFWMLAIVAVIWGLFAFRSGQQDGLIEAPLIPGESLGIYLPKRPLTFDEIRKVSSQDEHFRQFNNQSDAITGNDQVHVWLRIPLKNQTDQSMTYIIEVEQHLTAVTRLFIPSKDDSYTAYQPSPSGDPSIQQTSDQIPAFRLRLAPDQEAVYYLKLQDARWVSPKIRFWDSPILFQEAQKANERFVNRYVGLLIGLFIANLAIFTAFRYKDVGYYLLYLVPAFAINLLNFNAYRAQQWNFIGSTSVRVTSDPNFFVFHGLLILTAALHLLFVHEFIGRNQLSKRTNQILSWCLLGLFILAPIAMFGPGVLLGDSIRPIAVTLWCSVTATILSLGIWGIFKGVTQTRYLVAANCLLAIASVRYTVTALAQQTISADQLHFWLYAACVEMIILSYALIERFVQIDREKKQVQSNLLDEAYQHGELQRRFNEKLSHTVSVRTKELEAANQQKERLIEFLAHDIRTPLNALVSVSSLLARSPGDFSKAKLEAFAQQIEGDARGVSELMENLLSWANLQNQRIQLHPQEYLVDDLLSEAIASVQTQAHLKSIQVSQYCPKQCFVICDFNTILSVLRNLLSNAVKFVPEGGQISLKVLSVSGIVTFHISDSGTGLTPEQINRIHRQQTLESKRGLDGEYGVGLGLSICFELLKAHQSRLEVDSQLDQGSHFRFSLHQDKPSNMTN